MSVVTSVSEIKVCGIGSEANGGHGGAAGRAGGPGLDWAREQQTGVGLCRGTRVEWRTPGTARQRTLCGKHQERDRIFGIIQQYGSISQQRSLQICLILGKNVALFFCLNILASGLRVFLFGSVSSYLQCANYPVAEPKWV